MPRLRARTVRLRRHAQHTWLRFLALIGRARSGGIYVIVDRVQDDGEAIGDPLRSCIREFADAGVEVHLLVLQYSRDADRAMNRLRDCGQLPRTVTVKFFWRDAAPSRDGGAHADPVADLPRGASAVRMPGPTDRTIYFLDGLPVRSAVRLDPGMEVEHFGPSAMPVRRDDYDERGRLVRVLDLQPGTGKVATRHYLDADGRCWLSARVDLRSGRSGPLQVHLPAPQEFATYRDVRARWVAAQLRGSASPLVISSNPMSGRVAAKSDHAGVCRIALTDPAAAVDPGELLDIYRHRTARVGRRRPGGLPPSLGGPDRVAGKA